MFTEGDQPITAYTFTRPCDRSVTQAARIYCDFSVLKDFVGCLLLLVELNSVYI